MPASNELRLGVLWGSFMRHQKLGKVQSPLDMVRLAHDYGYNSFLFSAGRTLDIEDTGAVAETKRVLDELGMTATVAAGLVSRIMRDDSDYVRAAFEAAVQLEAHCVNTTWSPGMNTRWNEGWDQASADEYVKRDTQATARLAELAAEYEMPVAFENHLDYILQEVARILGAVPSPYIGLNFDTGNPLLFLQDPMEYARRFAGRIFSTHLKDAYALPDPDGARIVWCEVGEGLVDVPGILGLIRRQDRNVPLNLEYWAQAAHGVPYESEAYWEHLLIPRWDAQPVLDHIKAGLENDRPALSEGDEAGLQDEVRAMRSMPIYVRSVLGE